MRRETLVIAHPAPSTIVAFTELTIKCRAADSNPVGPLMVCLPFYFPQSTGQVVPIPPAKLANSHRPAARSKPFPRNHRRTSRPDAAGPTAARPLSAPSARKRNATRLLRASRDLFLPKLA